MADHPPSGSATPSPDLDPASAVGPVTPQAPGRFWAAAVVGTGLAFLVGWLLMAPLAPIMYVLGLFFFLLIALLIGAATFRIAQPAAPIPRPRLIVLTGVVALTLWSATMAKEYQHFSTLVAEFARNAVRNATKEPLTPAARQRIDEGVRESVTAQLKAAYPPGGFLGYMRWSVVSGQMDVPRVVNPSTVHFVASQHGFWWVFRVIMSLVFTAGAFASQVLPLGPPPPAPSEVPESEASKL